MRFFLSTLALSVSTLTAYGKVSIVNYNVENFFNATHEEGVQDWEYLPNGFPGRDP